MDQTYDDDLCLAAAQRVYIYIRYTPKEEFLVANHPSTNRPPPTNDEITQKKRIHTHKHTKRMQLQNVMGGLAALAGAASAMPTVTLPKDKETRTVQPRGSAADTVIAIMPLSTSCDGRGDECVTAAVAGPLLASGMSHYGVNTAIEQAGILSLVAYESVEMQYKINQNPTNAASGQGTSNEQSGVFNLQFANTFDELKDLGLTTGSVLDHVTDNKYNFWTVSFPPPPSPKKKKVLGL